MTDALCLCRGHLEETTRYEDDDGSRHIWFGWVIDEVEPTCPTHGDQSPTARG